MTRTRNNRSEWRIGNDKLGGFPAIRLSEPQWDRPNVQNPFEGPEIALAGRFGEIWQVNLTDARAVVRSSSVAKRMGIPRANLMKRGDELLVTFPLEDIKKWHKALRVPISRETQCKLAHEF